MPTFLGMKHIALPAFDLERAIQFYTTYLGFDRYYESDKDWTMIYSQGSTLSFLKMKEGEKAPDSRHTENHPQHVGVVLSTKKDVDELFSRLELDGYHPFQKKEHRDGSYGFYLRDTEQNAIEVIFIPLSPFLSSFHSVPVFSLVDSSWHASIERHFFKNEKVKHFTADNDGLKKLSGELEGLQKALVLFDGGKVSPEKDFPEGILFKDLAEWSEPAKETHLGHLIQQAHGELDRHA